jgi:hypothetical protein
MRADMLLPIELRGMAKLNDYYPLFLVNIRQIGMMGPKKRRVAPLPAGAMKWSCIVRVGQKRRVFGFSIFLLSFPRKRESGAELIPGRRGSWIPASRE